jgi:magnesium transporter
VIVDCAHYAHGKRQNPGAKLTLEGAAATVSERTDDFVWIGLHEPGPEELGELERHFGLHELALEDAHRAHQRPKIEDYDDSYFIVLRTAHYHQSTEEVHFGEIHMFAGSGYVVTIRHGPGSELKTARTRLEARPDLLELGPASAVWAVVDKVVDDYAPVVDGIDDDIEEVESDVFASHRRPPTERIYKLKREVIEFHRAVWPLLNPLEALQHGGYARIPDELRRYFRDVLDHARRVDEQVNSQRELLTSVLEANLALTSVSQNEIVKKISAIAAIVAVPTFIASVYGMNFTHMPELDSRAGYPLALGVMALCVIALSIFFRRIQWL